MATVNEFVIKFRGALIAGIATLAVGAISAASLAVYQVARDIALRSWVVEHVDQRFEQEEVRRQIRSDIARLMALKEKASDPDVIAGLERQITELEARLEG
jgi:hypothetical protein